MKKYDIEFLGTCDGNALALSIETVADHFATLHAVIDTPDGASDDYGYIAMKAAIIADLEKHGFDASRFAFQYDGQEDKLAEDASADSRITVDIDYDALADLIAEADCDGRHISIDNGHTFVTPAEALQAVSIDTMAEYMDDDAREQTARELAPCSDEEFLTRYLLLAPDDLIIG